MSPLALILVIAAALQTPPAAGGHRVRLHNQTGEAIVALEARSEGREDWRANLLADRQNLPAGQQLAARLDDGRGGCRFRLSGRTAGGAPVVKAVDACRVLDVFLTR